MPNESGDMKLMGNLRLLTDLVSADATYNPANPALAVTALESQYTAGMASVTEISSKLAPNKVSINDRQILFETLRQVVLRSRNMLTASNVSEAVRADAETYVRKLTGKRKSAKPPATPDDPATPENEAGASHSASQMSFDNQVGNFASYIQLLANVSEYKPNEADLKVTGLNALLDDLQAKNNAVSSSFVPLSQARGVRDNLLYTGADCIANTGQLVKAYVKAAMGTNSQLYKQIKGLKFDRAGKK